ncbi:DUF4349 domain-containing protein [Niveibacterium sp. SC-1]|uniref:DUF4349 domain-containing protein n=1 Tax=Niveibacterium sp. SC-1 TaxID=3135646 RepID=UPI00311DE09B
MSDSRSALLSCLVFSALLLTACGRKEEPVAPGAAAPAPMMAEAMKADSRAAAPPQRYIALRHNLVIDSPAAALPRVFEDALKRCQAAGCEVLATSLQRETEYNPPSATLSVRMPPQAVEAFLEGFKGEAQVLQHNRSAEDKTDAVIDAEARIRNLTELRDRLRAMLASQKGSIKDVLEVEKQLTETQSQLDAIQAVRKVLANETEKVAVDIEFRARPRISERGFFSPVSRAWDNAGEVLMGSLGGLITFLAAALPWLLVLMPAGWGLRALWRRRRSA